MLKAAAYRSDPPPVIRAARKSSHRSPERRVIIRHADYDGDVSSIDTCPDNVVVMGLKSNPYYRVGFLGWNCKSGEYWRNSIRRICQGKKDGSWKRYCKTSLTVCRERTGACKHNVILSYLMRCQQKTVVFGWHRDLIEDLASKLRQAGRGVVTYIGGTRSLIKSWINSKTTGASSSSLATSIALRPQSP